jgi:hypothetical protein
MTKKSPKKQERLLSPKLTTNLERLQNLNQTTRNRETLQNLKMNPRNLEQLLKMNKKSSNNSKERGPKPSLNAKLKVPLLQHCIRMSKMMNKL